MPSLFFHTFFVGRSMNTNEISRVDVAINYAVDELSKSDAVIAQIQSEYMQIVVDGPHDNAGFATADAALKRMVRLRNDVDKQRKELKKDSVRYGKAVDGEAKRIQALIEPIELHLKTQSDIVRLEQKRLEVVEENRRREEVRGWIERLNEIGAPVNPDQLNGMTPEDFGWHLKAAKSEADKRDAERADFEKQQAELQAEREAMQAEREAVQAARDELAAEREKIAAERKADIAVESQSMSMTEQLTVRVELDDFAAGVAWLDIPDSLLAYDWQIRNALRTASDAIKEIV